MGWFRKNKKHEVLPPPPVPVSSEGMDVGERYCPFISVWVPEGWAVKESHTLLAPDGQANVIASSEPLYPPMDAARYADIQGQVLRGEYPGYREIAFQEAVLSGDVPGFLRTFSWNPPDNVPVTQIQFSCVRGALGFTTTATIPSTQFSGMESRLRRVVTSVRLGDDQDVQPAARSAISLDVSTTRERVQQMLIEILGSIEVSAEDVMSFPYESTRVFVEVQPFDESSVVAVFAVAAVDTPITPDLYRYVATKTDTWYFGHLGLSETPTGATVLFRRSLLADFLDKAELHHLLGVVATTADEVDEEIVETLGGKRFRDTTDSPEGDWHPVRSERRSGEATGYL